ncbi:MAG: YcnI family protein [Cyanobacteriota bacterium]|nr:YcnI family protein [Cyanobacteriota bacterium]
MLTSSLVVGITPPSLAHVTVWPKEAPANGYAKLTFRVPHGCEGSPTTKVRVQLPKGSLSVKPMVHPGWEISTVKVKLDTPIESHGKPITETVAEVVWTGGPLLDEFMDEFSLSLKLPDLPDQVVPIPVVQECEQGVHRWIEVAAPGEDPEELAEPAPLLKLVRETASH